MTFPPHPASADAVRVPGVHVPVLGTPVGPRPAPVPLRWRLPLGLVAPVGAAAIYAAVILSALGWAVVERIFRAPSAVTVLDLPPQEPLLASVLAPLLSGGALVMVGTAAITLGIGAVWCARRPSAVRTAATVSAATAVPVLLASLVVPALQGQGWSGAGYAVVVLFILVLAGCGAPVVAAMVLVLRQAGATARSGGAYPLRNAV